MLPKRWGHRFFPSNGHASGEGMFNLLTVVLPRPKVIFAEMLQDCHELKVGSPIFESLRLPTTAMRRRNDRPNTSTTYGICESLFRFQGISSLIDNKDMTEFFREPHTASFARVSRHPRRQLSARWAPTLRRRKRAVAMSLSSPVSSSICKRTGSSRRLTSKIAALSLPR
jgi:hypothetical protein